MRYRAHNLNNFSHLIYILKLVKRLTNSNAYTHFLEVDAPLQFVRDELHPAQQLSKVCHERWEEVTHGKEQDKQFYKALTNEVTCAANTLDHTAELDERVTATALTEIIVPQSYNITLSFPPDLQLLFEKFNSKLKATPEYGAASRVAPEHPAHVTDPLHNTSDWNLVNPELFAYLRCPAPIQQFYPGTLVKVMHKRPL